MEGTASILGALGLSLLCGLLASGCSSGAHAPAGRPYLAQTMAMDCKPGESSVVCCIKKWGPESCGFSASEAADLINGARVLNEAAQAATDGAEAKPKVTAKEDDPDEGWKQHCMDTYVACKNQKGWVGNCYDCFRNCEGQRQWPFHLCTRRGKVR